MTEQVSIVLTLRENARSLAGIEKVKQLAQALGMEPSSAGGATVTCRVSEKNFRKLFGKSAVRVDSREVSAADGGSPAGYAETVLPVAESLVEWVEGVAVMPPATRMRGSF